MASRFGGTPVASPRFGGTPVKPKTKEDEIADMTLVDVEKASWGDVISKGITNSPKAAMQMAMDIKNMAMHPGDTFTGLANMTAGLIEKAFPGTQQEEQYADLLIDFFKERYGSPEGLKKAIATDLPGVMSDIGAILVPGGQAVRGVGTASKLRSIATMGRAISKIGGVMDLPTAIMKTPKFAGQVLLRNKPYKMYAAAAKFSKSLSRETREALTTLAVDEAIMPTVKGLDKVRSKINIINDQISDLIQRGVDQGKEIPINALFTEFNTLRKEANILEPTRPQLFQKMINRVAKDMHQANTLINQGKLTPIEVQRIKQNIYKETSKYYAGRLNEKAGIKISQSIARSAKESLENLFPEIKGLNKAKGDYRELAKAIDDVADGIDRASLMNIGTMSRVGVGSLTGGLVGNLIGGAGATAAGGTIGTGIGIAHSIYSHPKVKARLAIIANKLQKQGVILGPAWTELGIAARQPERIDEE